VHCDHYSKFLMYGPLHPQGRGLIWHAHARRSWHSRRQQGTCPSPRDKTTLYSNDSIYQFQSSSSSSFTSGVGGGSVFEEAARVEAATTTSGRIALPRAVLPASSSSSISDCVGGADAGPEFTDDAGARADKIECETSERSTEARFWPFENVCPLCSSASLDPTESTQPCAVSPRFARPSPIAPSGLMGGIDTDDVGDEAALTLARFPELERGFSPVSGLSASASATRELYERRCRTLLDDDGEEGDGSEDIGPRFS